MKIKEGSRWTGTGSSKDVFVVLHIVEQEGHTWVHYRKDNSGTPEEYSCFQESFLSRFTQLPE